MSVRRGGIVSGVWPASELHGVGEPVELLLGRPEAHRDPNGVDHRQVPQDRERTGPQLLDRGGGRPARDPEGDQRRHRPARRHERDPGDPRQPVGRPGRQAGRALVRPREPDVHRDPAAAARQADDRRSVEARRLEPPGAGPQHRPLRVELLVRQVRGVRGRQRVREAAAHPQRGHALGPEQPLLARRARRRRPPAPPRRPGSRRRPARRRRS